MEAKQMQLLLLLLLSPLLQKAINQCQRSLPRVGPACDGVLLANGQHLQQRNVKLLFVHRHTSSTRRNKRCSKHTLAGTLAIFSLFVVQRNVGVYVCTCVCVYLDLFTQHRVSKYTKYTTCTKC